MLDPAITERIRTIFLHPRAYVSIEEAAVMLDWSHERMTEALERGEVDLVRTCSGEGVPREEVISQATAVWPLDVIEEALGRSASSVLPAALRTRNVRVRLPQYQVAMLERLAATWQRTVSQLLTYELEDLAAVHFDEFAQTIPGFAEAFHWPNHEKAELPS
jgi:hypothetical protein